MGAFQGVGIFLYVYVFFRVFEMQRFPAAEFGCSGLSCENSHELPKLSIQGKGVLT